MKRPKPYGTEAELCDAFVETAALMGWRAYPECGHFDLLMVSEDGTQVGVEAKLRSNLDVVAQVLPGYRGYCTNYLGVLVPSASPQLQAVCHALHIHTWDDGWIRAETNIAAHGDAVMRREAGSLRLRLEWRVDPAKPVKLPAVPLQGSGGEPCPRVMSGWRESALLVCLELERKGYLTRADIVAHGISPTAWTTRWLVADGQETGTKGRPVTKYVRNQESHDFPSRGYEKEFEAMRGTR